MRRRARIVCWSVAVGAAAAGLLVRAMPVGSSVAPIAPAVTASTQALSLPPVDQAIAEEIVMANVFDPSRTPPSRRYAPPEFGEDSTVEMMAGELSEPDPDPGVDGLPVLYGTVVGPDGTKALLHLDPSHPGPRLYAAGERDGGYRVVSIAPRAVVLSGPGGRKTLRLDPQEDRP